MWWWLVTWLIAMITFLAGYVTGQGFARQATVWAREDHLQLWLITGFLIGVNRMPHLAGHVAGTLWAFRQNH